MTRQHWTSITLALMLAGELAGQPSWRSLLSEDLLNSMDVSVYITRLDTEEVLFAYDEMKPRTAASVQKLPTTMMANEELGPNYRYKTEVSLIGEVQAEVLCGDVVVIAGGDPTLGATSMGGVALDDMAQDLIDNMHQLGVKKIDGEVLIYQDGEHFDQGRPGEQLLEDVANYYGGGYYPVNVQENAFDITLSRSTGEGQILAFDTLAAYQVVARGIGVSGRRDLAYVYDGDESRTYVVRGTLPDGKKPYTIRGAMRNPADYLGRWMVRAFHQADINIQGHQVIQSRRFDDADHLWQHTYHSPPIQELYQTILHRSHNLLARALYRSALDVADGVPVMYTPGIEGSGLTPLRSWSARELMDVLSHAYQSDGGDWLMQYLPQNGRHGTVKSILAELPGTLYLKSGSMKGTLNYMGIHPTEDQGMVGFVLLANSRDTSRGDLLRLWHPILERIARL